MHTGIPREQKVGATGSRRYFFYFSPINVFSFAKA